MSGRAVFDFSGQVVLVSGAARGIGRELVYAFTRSGARVAAVDRDPDGLKETCTEAGATCRAFVADIRDAEAVERLFAALQEGWGGLDVCVNNAAVAPHAALLDESVDVWDTVYAVNCRGTFLMTRAAARMMIAAGRGGRIINFSSAAAKRGSAGAAAYASSRAAVESFTRVAAVELAPYEILVNAVSPGLIDTQPKPLPPEMKAALEGRIPTLPLARPGCPQEVAEVVLFLASASAGYITGAVIDVDGGSSVGRRPEGTVCDDDPRYFWVTGKQVS